MLHRVACEFDDPAGRVVHIFGKDKFCRPICIVHVAIPPLNSVRVIIYHACSQINQSALYFPVFWQCFPEEKFMQKAALKAAFHIYHMLQTASSRARLPLFIVLLIKVFVPGTVAITAAAPTTLPMRKSKSCAFHIHFKLPSSNEFSLLICAKREF